ncbi:Arc family DNA-binding protein [Agrobacterium salinitolerans]|uniref:Arc family DNA-binding protein n=1 Tax=Agrobacterium salinitolerans TaxID=1183413 RepID=UPI001C215471|nr:Arc family DNA-binding protein [Agrobacterium salinitolerans]QXC50938.1 Arc family DNA-binding protein [Agrobacterium salinitolerans]
MAEDQNRTLQDKFMLRFPEGMRDELKAAAELLGRSMNAEIIQRLKRSFKEDRDERVKLALSGDLWNSLMVDASMNDLSMEERATQILQSAYDGTGEYAQSVEKTLALASENAELTDLVSQMKEKEDADFLLYYTKTVQLSQFVKSVIAAGSDVPKHLLETAEELQALSQAEFETLRQRHEMAMFMKRRVEELRRLDQEIEENSSDADGLISPADIVSDESIRNAAKKQN